MLLSILLLFSTSIFALCASGAGLFGRQNVAIGKTFLDFSETETQVHMDASTSALVSQIFESNTCPAKVKARASGGIIERRDAISDCLLNTYMTLVQNIDFM